MKKILLVEDDAAIRDAFSLLLEGSAYRLQTLENGQAIINSEIDPPDLFILDRNIAGVSGIFICHFLKYSPLYKQVPVIMISATPDIVTEAQKAGADGVIEKPFSIHTVREIIKKHLQPEG